MQTSNFARSKTDPNAVAISRGIPRWYKGRRYMPLAPSWELIEQKDATIYRQLYHEQVLSRLDPHQVYADLGPDAIMLCWESPGKFCHRRLAAEWLENALGIKIDEKYDQVHQRKTQQTSF
jgi:uncharacterized protein (DUF488 family)